MTEAVIDSSIALTWCFEDEASAETDALFERVRDEGALAPGLWRLELGSVLLQAERRGRISTGEVAARLDLIAELPISIDRETADRGARHSDPGASRAPDGLRRGIPRTRGAPRPSSPDP